MFETRRTVWRCSISTCYLKYILCRQFSFCFNVHHGIVQNSTLRIRHLFREIGTLLELTNCEHNILLPSSYAPWHDCCIIKFLYLYFLIIRCWISTDGHTSCCYGEELRIYLRLLNLATSFQYHCFNKISEPFLHKAEYFGNMFFGKTVIMVCV